MRSVTAVLGLLTLGPATGVRAEAQRLYFQHSGQVMMVDLASGQLTPLTRATGSFSFDPPQVSPDGSEVFYTLEHNIWAIRTGRTAPRQVTKLGRVLAPADDEEPEEADECDGPLLSPDGRWLAYRFTSTKGGMFLRVCRPDGSGDRALCDEVMLGPEAWTPDGKAIVCGRDGALVEVRLQDGQVTPLLADRGQRWDDGQATFARDGRMAFTRDMTPSIRYPDGHVERAVPEGLDGQWPTFSPDGSKLAVFRTVIDPQNMGHQWHEIHVVELPGLEATKLVTTDTGGELQNTAFIVGWRDDQHLVVVRTVGDESRKLYSIDVATHQAELLFKATTDDEGFVLWP